MATVYPSPLPPALETYEQANGEFLVLKALRDTLDDEFSIFWSTHGRDQGGNPVEADIVVVHPDMAIAFIEVKGGFVTIGDPHDNLSSWATQTRINRVIKPIKNPWHQVKVACFSLLRNMKDAKVTNRYMPLARFVALPHTVPSHGIRDSLPRDIRDCFIFSSDLPAIGTLVTKVMMEEATRTKNTEVPGPDTPHIIDYLASAHGPPSEMAVSRAKTTGTNEGVSPRAQPSTPPAAPENGAASGRAVPARSKKRRRAAFVLAGAAGLGTAAVLALLAFPSAIPVLRVQCLAGLTPCAEDTDPHPSARNADPTPEPERAARGTSFQAKAETAADTQGPAQPKPVAPPPAAPSRAAGQDCKPYTKPGDTSGYEGLACRRPDGRWTIIY